MSPQISRAERNNDPAAPAADAKKSHTSTPRAARDISFQPQLDETFASRLLAFLKGELTWAQVEGWTGEQAYAFAKIATDLMEAGQLEPAEKMFSALNAINPLDWFFPYCLAQIARLRGQNERAIEYLDESCRQTASRAEPRLLRALCHLASSNVETAKTDLLKVGELAENDSNEQVSRMAAVADAMMQRLADQNEKEQQAK